MGIKKGKNCYGRDFLNFGRNNLCVAIEPRRNFSDVSTDVEAQPDERRFREKISSSPSIFFGFFSFLQAKYS